MTDYMVLPRGKHTTVKELEFFKAQGGEHSVWGEVWKPVKARDLEHARLQGSLMPPYDDYFLPRVVLEHKAVTHQDCDNACCPICCGGLFLCEHCGGLEGGLPTECPGRQLSFDESQDIYHGLLDFHGGLWVKNHRTKYMYPQDEYCDICRGENSTFERDYFAKDFALWHKAKEHPEVVVRCGFSLWGDRQALIGK